MQTNFDHIQAKNIDTETLTSDGEVVVFVAGNQQAHSADVAQTSSSSATTFTAPALLADAAKLTDVQILQTKLNQAIVDIAALTARINEHEDTFEEFDMKAAS